MKRRSYLFAAIALSAVLAAGSLTAANLPQTADAAAADYRYARRDDPDAVSLTAADIIRTYFSDGAVDEAEEAYLASHSDFVLTYSDTIPASSITARGTELSGSVTLDVTAVPQQYTALNRASVVWTPQTVNGAPMSESGGVYSYHFEGETDADTVEVEFGTELTVLASDINAFLNAANTAGRKASEKLALKEAEYAQASEAYSRDLAAHTAYLAAMEAYSRDLAAYESYRVALRDYQAKKQLYDEYLAAKRAYEAEKEAYDNYDARVEEYNRKYQEYLTYLQDLEEYPQKVAEYEAATANEDAQTVLYQIGILDFALTPMTDMKRVLADSILGDTVSRVLAEKEALTVAGKVEAAVIDLANDATYILRRNLAELKKCKTDEEKYFYYVGYHETLREQFTSLLQALDYLYQNPEKTIPKSVIDRMGKTRQFRILLAQLYNIVNALTEGNVPSYVVQYKYGNRESYSLRYFDALYRIDGMTPNEILSASLEDRDLTEPLENGYPNLPPKPEQPKEVKDPGSAPVRPAIPVAPDPVPDPGPAPKTVSEPTMPKEVPEPTLPVAYVPTAEETALRAAYEADALPVRQPLAQNLGMKLKTRVVKYFRNAHVADLYFYADSESTEPIYVVREAELGGGVSYGGPVPTRQLRGHTCTFAGWADESGAAVDLKHLDREGEVKLHPVFQITPNLYTVIWKIDGRIVRDKVAFGELPRYDGTPEMVRDGIRKYRFTGWQQGETFYPEGSPLLPMEDVTVTYEAVFETGRLVTWKGGGKTVVQAYWKGDLPTAPFEPTMSDTAYERFTFSGWDKDISEVGDRDVTYTAQFRSAKFLTEGDRGLAVAYSEGAGYSADCTSVTKELQPAGLFAAARERGAAVELVFRTFTLKFDAASVIAAAEASVTALSMQAAQDAAYAYSFLLTLSAAETVDCSVRATVSGRFDPENSYLYAIDGDTASPVRYLSLSEDGITLMMRPGTLYRIYPQYVVTVLTTEGITMSVSTTLAAVGERVQIYVSSVPEGSYLRSVYALDGAGNELSVNNMSFVMPAGDVRVGARAELFTYTVQFKLDGKTLSTHTYRYGETIVPPPDPGKASDASFQYTFKGWDGEFGPATHDAVYNAVFEASPLPVVVQEETTITKLLHIAYVAVPVFLVLLVGLIALLIVLHIRKKKRRAAQARNAEASIEAPALSEEEAEASIEAPALSEEEGEASMQAPALLEEETERSMQAPPVLRGEGSEAPVLDFDPETVVPFYGYTEPFADYSEPQAEYAEPQFFVEDAEPGLSAAVSSEGDGAEDAASPPEEGENAEK